jgi:hypothetical protein
MRNEETISLTKNKKFLLLMTELPLVPVKKRIYLYNLDQKREILLHQRLTKKSNIEIGNIYNVGESAIRKWAKNIDIDIDLEQKSSKLTMHSGRKSVGDHLESDLCDFIDGLRDQEHIVTPELCAFEVFKMDPEFKDGDIKKIRRWIYPFLDRNGYLQYERQDPRSAKTPG